jgi:pimeloyl-ACP methyl ester carboxylesterase
MLKTRRACAVWSSSMRTLLFLCTLTIAAAPLKSIPPPGIAVPEEVRLRLNTSLDELNKSIGLLGQHALLPDVLIFREAVRIALHHNEFFKADEFAKAEQLLKEGQRRADLLLQKQAPWTQATGLVPRGYVSRIDGSVQPYGLVLPDHWSPRTARPWRLDLWFHGRSETLSELNFLHERMTKRGEFTPDGAIVLHLYGRYCNANRFAGEVDAFEALADVRRHYRIDENRISVRGFSMGGAATWHMAAHHAGMWAAAAPGAGFSESPQYLAKRIAQLATPLPWWHDKLRHLYDSTDYAANFLQLPLIAYSGEIDPQKQAADVMATALASEGMKLTHIIGPQTQHKYHPDSKREIDQRMDAIVERGRNPYPARLSFTTWTLRYNRMKWLTIDAMDEHWSRARVDAELTANGIRLQAKNVQALSLHFGPGGWPFAANHRPVLEVNGQKINAPTAETDLSFHFSLQRQGALWSAGTPAGQRKRHGLQGPIDDAFFDSFLFVLPDQPMAGRREQEEAERAIREWRKQFRGDARVRKASEVTAEDIEAHHLVCFGDAASNSIIARAALPVRWEAGQLVMGEKRYAAAQHMPVLIYPNSLNPARYIVLNSGPTLREMAQQTNAFQYPHLPDYAIVDTSVPPDEFHPGRILEAGFFNEEWRIPAAPEIIKRTRIAK